MGKKDARKRQGNKTIELVSQKKKRKKWNKEKDEQEE